MKQMLRNHVAWSDTDLDNLEHAKSFKDLALIALDVLAKMPEDVAIVSGPISTGGHGAIEANLEVFDATIEKLILLGITTFDQMPFEDHIFRMIEQGEGAREQNQLLEQFYRPIFESGRIKRVYFIHDWQSSNGARWEHDLAEQRGLTISYLDPDFLDSQKSLQE